jgi:methylisocitrate lyase
VVIYPATLLRLAMRAADNGLTELAAWGTQEDLLYQMQGRQDLCELLDCRGYSAFDASVSDFEV